MPYFCHSCRMRVGNEEIITVDEMPICSACHSGFLEEINDSNGQEFQFAELQDAAEVESDALEFSNSMRWLEHGRLSQDSDSGSSNDWASRQASRRRLEQRQQQRQQRHQQQQDQPQQQLSASGHVAAAAAPRRRETPTGFFPSHLLLRTRASLMPDSRGDLERELEEMLEFELHGAAYCSRSVRSADLALIQAATIGVEEAGQQCTVCLDEFAEGESADRLPCQHHFHSQCIREWLAKCNSCPVCRKPLPFSRTAEDAPSPAEASGYSSYSSNFNWALWPDYVGDEAMTSSLRRPESRRFRSSRQDYEDGWLDAMQRQQLVQDEAAAIPARMLFSRRLNQDDSRRRLRFGLPPAPPPRQVNPVVAQVATQTEPPPPSQVEVAPRFRSAFLEAERPLEGQQPRQQQEQEQEQQEEQSLSADGTEHSLAQLLNFICEEDQPIPAVPEAVAAELPSHHQEASLNAPACAAESSGRNPTMSLDASPTGDSGDCAADLMAPASDVTQ